jgi:serine/threonine protein kinase
MNESFVSYGMDFSLPNLIGSRVHVAVPSSFHMHTLHLGYVLLVVMGLSQSSRCLPIAIEVSGKGGVSSEETTPSLTYEELHTRMVITTGESGVVDEGVLGKGTFGKVSLVVQRHSDGFTRRLAMKRATKDPEHETLANERSILLNLDHPHIIKLYGYCDTRLWDGRLSRCQLSEYCANGELFHFIVSKGPLSEDVAKDYFFQILKGLNYMHTVAKLVHRDLKPENILLTNDGKQIKICDLGTAVRLAPDTLHTRKAHGRIGSLSYAAPEVYTDSLADFSSDIWSAGVILYVMFCAASPFRNSEDTDPETAAINRVKKGDINKQRKSWRLMPAEPKNLVSKILNLSSVRRPTAAQLLSHHWFSDLKKNEAISQGVPVTYAVESLLNFFTLSESHRDCWIAIADQMVFSWKFADDFFNQLDHNMDGIVDSSDLHKAGVQPHELGKLLVHKTWFGYSEIVASLASRETESSDLQTILLNTIPFAFDAMYASSDYPISIEEFRKVVLGNFEKSNLAPFGILFTDSA